MKTKMRIMADGHTDKGMKRPKNEDSFVVEQEAGVFVVADGVGGSACGEVASKMAVDIISAYFRNGENTNATPDKGNTGEHSSASSAVVSAVKQANEQIYNTAKDDPKLSGMATTVVAAALRGDRLSIAHAGDSRLYLIRGNTIEQLTDDHSLIAEQIRKGMMTKEEAHEVGMRNVITQSLGFTPDIEVDIEEMTVYDGDALLLCSDGLYTMVPDMAILHTVKSSVDPRHVCERLVDLANKKGGRDNITVVVAYIYKKTIFSFMYDLIKWIRR
ncbi:MAG: Stp1/IreP family PP2C-type Ser/Thr phosphatase [Nitrospirae bacterium]|nr:Stp1/IreP family PP2C-type Ser/Thr phosphatase [Nitrospirota bacterium]